MTVRVGFDDPSERSNRRRSTSASELPYAELEYAPFRVRVEVIADDDEELRGWLVERVTLYRFFDDRCHRCEGDGKARGLAVGTTCEVCDGTGHRERLLALASSEMPSVGPRNAEVPLRLAHLPEVLVAMEEFYAGEREAS